MPDPPEIRERRHEERFLEELHARGAAGAFLEPIVRSTSLTWR
jgi:hypothetical protein